MKNKKEVELLLNRYDENDFNYETIHFTVERSWLEDEISPQTVEKYLEEYDSDDSGFIYDYAMLYGKILEEWSEYHNSMKDIFEDQEEQKAVERFYGVNGQ